MSWGLSLSGGSACGLANIGVLRVLESKGYRPTCVAGSSMGAIVGGLYALGVPVDDIAKMARGIRLRKMVRLTKAALRMGLHGGFLKPDLATVLRPVLGDARIGDCRIPFLCIAGRIRKPIPWHRIVQPGFTEEFLATVEQFVFPPETRLLDAMLATSAIPTLFSPVSIGDDTFIDLCNFGAIPAPHLRARCTLETIIATDTTSDMFEWLWPALPEGCREFIAASQKAVRHNLKSADIVIRPDIGTGMQFRFDKAQLLMDAGEDAARGKLVAIRRALSERRSG